MAKTKHIAPARRKRKSQVSTEESGEKLTEEQTETVCLEEQVEEEAAAAVVSTEVKVEEKDQDEIKPCTEADEEGQVDDATTATPSDQQQLTGSGKRKVESDNDGCESKKIKLINDGHCLYVGNLNKSKSFDEILDSLTTYLVKQCLLFQDVRLDRSRKHAYVDLASEMDLNKALALNGEMMLDQALKMAKAKVKTAEQVKKKKKKKTPSKNKANNTRCLFLKNLPYTATKEDIMKFFNDDVTIRFPGGAEGPSHGIAFVDFKSNSIAKKMQQEKHGSHFQGRELIVDFTGGKPDAKVTKAEIIKDKTKAPPPSTTLFVRNLSINVKQKQLRKIFPDAVNIRLPDKNGKSKGFAFVEFPSVADAEKALQSTGRTKLCKRPMRVQFFEEREKKKRGNVDFKTLMIGGLAETTTSETLKNAFEGACSARIPVDKETNVSKKFGFVVFESEDVCKAAKKAMEDCEIDSSKVTISFARSKIEKGQTGIGGAVGRPSDKTAGQGADKGKKESSSQGGKRPGAALETQKAKDVENKG